ncbi:hypothetical protein MBM_09287 [Drepanopeziza brunnea f. sp. 'multigermtubi' MB_m1]|uniref:Uncharacterized protein n=1 Tax=Marssonina brunnea f. sp. multigermtubi (strain MB_m1) TaxID=1072389 RepID=K1WI56_MARBU|nr:uncharacterized protein MBM_09287 [Drepanopeziza brunnea f. sp. 'multigermtubi' MB_m1]EKD12531.1 hypothetical protein MBM_09287 [Drepanopeziza brunnea f. sp. 'multigermtubi' MB_m1]
MPGYYTHSALREQLGADVDKKRFREIKDLLKSCFEEHLEDLEPIALHMSPNKEKVENAIHAAFQMISEFSELNDEGQKRIKLTLRLYSTYVGRRLKPRGAEESTEEMRGESKTARKENIGRRENIAEEMGRKIATSQKAALEKMGGKTAISQKEATPKEMGKRKTRKTKGSQDENGPLGTAVNATNDNSDDKLAAENETADPNPRESDSIHLLSAAEKETADPSPRESDSSHLLLAVENETTDPSLKKSDSSHFLPEDTSSVAQPGPLSTQMMRRELIKGRKSQFPTLSLKRIKLDTADSSENRTSQSVMDDSPTKMISQLVMDDTKKQVMGGSRSALGAKSTNTRLGSREGLIFAQRFSRAADEKRDR